MAKQHDQTSGGDHGIPSAQQARNKAPDHLGIGSFVLPYGLHLHTKNVCWKIKKNIDDHVASFIDPRAGYQFFIKVESLQKVHKNCALGTEISCDFLRKRQTNMPGRM
jgi:hypothetical protein